MDESESQTTEIAGGEPRSVGQAVGSLFEGATEALTRAANCNDGDWQKFHLGTAAVYKEWALRMEPLVGIQARIDEEVAMIRRRFNLGPLPSREAALKPDARKPEDVVTSPETIAPTSDPSPPLGSGHDYDVDDLEAFTQPPALT
jgi:hypothetical protein